MESQINKQQTPELRFIIQCVLAGLLEEREYIKQYYLEQAFRGMCTKIYVDTSQKDLGWKIVEHPNYGRNKPGEIDLNVKKLNRKTRVDRRSAFMILGRTITLKEFLSKDFENDVWFIGDEIRKGTNMFVVNETGKDHLRKNPDKYKNEWLIESVFSSEVDDDDGLEVDSIDFSRTMGINSDKSIRMFLFDKDCNSSEQVFDYL